MTFFLSNHNGPFALPAYHHLAEALGVSKRTIKRDMAALRAQEPDLPPPRGG
ncbi:HTH domain-containing protein [Litorilinea aerophila]|uniref:HTH domain-containing protein n=1 Tax=Litorilinea aerophila TaxID=1204385 RepID=UPI001E2EAA52|nr:HTH domain-containing protein [Litorilinea aerophila]MCC9075539.1 HTH domain-containing protein [Litorilinea aerophila]